MDRLALSDAEERSLEQSLRQADSNRAFDTQVRRLQAAARAEGLCASMSDGQLSAFSTGTACAAYRNVGGDTGVHAVTGKPTFLEQSA